MKRSVVVPGGGEQPQVVPLLTITTINSVWAFPRKKKKKLHLSKVTYWFHKTPSRAHVRAQWQQAAGLMVVTRLRLDRRLNQKKKEGRPEQKRENLSTILNPLMLRGNPISHGRNWNLFCHHNGELTRLVIELCLAGARGTRLMPRRQAEV